MKALWYSPLHMERRRGEISTISSQCQCQSQQQVPSNSYEIASRKIQSALSKVTSIICMQETTSCSKAPNTKVDNFNNFTMISISTHLLQNWCRKSSADGYSIPCINYYYVYISKETNHASFLLYFLAFVFFCIFLS